MYLNAPAGSLKSALSALDAGADSVYVGFNDIAHQRQQVRNLNLDELRELLGVATPAGKRVWITLNSSYTDAQLPAILARAELLEREGAHGVIVADVGLLRHLRDATPNLKLLFSVQGQCANVEAARHIRRLGAHRIVLDRDTTIAEAATIATNAGVDVELFAFGYMCNARDSVCYMGDHWSGSPCNVHCSQTADFIAGPPRSLRPGEEGSRRWLFMKFYSALRYVPQMLDAGIAALKIEGRHRSSRFVRDTTSVFREAIDHAQMCSETGKDYVPSKRWIETLRACAFGFEVTDGRYVDGHYHRTVQGRPSIATMARFATATVENAWDRGEVRQALAELEAGARRQFSPPPADRAETSRGPLP